LIIAEQRLQGIYVLIKVAIQHMEDFGSISARKRLMKFLRIPLVFFFALELANATGDVVISEVQNPERQKR
jgi:hypothetical protein